MIITGNADVDINASLTNAVAVRVLDSIATTEITRLDLSLFTTPVAYTTDLVNQMDY